MAKNKKVKMIGKGPASLRRRWTFTVGIGQVRLVTVVASDYNQALAKARDKEDRKAERDGREPPVAWDLFVDRVKRMED